MNVMRVLVLGVTRFDGEVEGKHFKTAKIIYLPATNIESNFKRGLIPVHVPSDFNIFEQITKVPAVYDIEYDLYSSGKGVNVRFMNAEFVALADGIADCFVGI